MFFDKNLFYPNFLSQLAVNSTLPLFGPRSWRIDDYNDPANWLREPTNNTVRVVLSLILKVTKLSWFYVGLC